MPTCCQPAAAAVPVVARPGSGLAEVFARYGEEYRRNHRLPSSHVKVMRAIEQCRTPALGGHMDECDVCGAQYLVWNSCNDPHCPTCGSMKRAKWLEGRRHDLLDVPNFHVVFTIDHDLNFLVGHNQDLFHNLLFAAAAETLQQFAHAKGGTLGVTAVLHTWDQQLNRHLHLHCVVPGGMLSLDRQRWIRFENGFLFPVRALSSVFRGKFLAALAEAHAQGRLVWPTATHPPPKGPDLKSLRRRLMRRPWTVYCQPPVAGAEAIINYLARYTYRVAISNQRIKQACDNTVTFEYKDRKDGDKVKTSVLSADEFIRRFLLHVLPERSHRIRYYGFLANRNKKELLARCRELLQQPQPPTVGKKTARTLMLGLTGKDISRCPNCETGTLRTVARILPPDFPESLLTAQSTEAPNTS